MSLYEQRGVSSQKEEVHKAVSKLGKGIFENTFCKIIEDELTKDENNCLIMHADGAGTKSSIAYAYWKETGDLSVWKGIAQDALVMNIDDMFCVGDFDKILINSTIGRNKRLIPAEVLEAIIDGTIEFINKMKNFGLEIVHTGGETADVGDLVRTIIVDFTAIGRLPKAKVKQIRIQPKDVIVGLASFGKATYEDEYNSGIGSNGLTQARHELFNKTIGNKYPETYDNDLDESIVYVGEYDLTTVIPELNKSVGQLILSPTRTYVPILKEIYQQYFEQIHGIIHCTGGGQTKVMKFVDKMHIIKDNLFETPPIFKMLTKTRNIREMYEVFNMGHRLEIYTDKETADEIIKIARKYNIDGRIIGYCKESDTKKLTLKTEFGEFFY